MSELVRVAIGPGTTALVWPKCCPTCGTKATLVETQRRLGRVKSIRPNLLGGLTMKSDVLHLSFPACSKHSREIRRAGLVLDNGPIGRFLRPLIYLGALTALGLLFHLARVRDLGIILLFPVAGICGLAAIIWAHLVSSVWPKRFDPDMDVVEIQFQHAAYVGAFRRLNAAATKDELTRAPPWYLRASIWKVALLVILFVLIGRLVGR
ncbi:MAG: hypothetical protein JWL65_2212 [Gammaproteobacteria bacterium]|nr:hypothetical protein [Gammaproteobacteria bacterium]